MYGNQVAAAYRIKSATFDRESAVKEPPKRVASSEGFRVGGEVDPAKPAIASIFSLGF